MLPMRTTIPPRILPAFVLAYLAALVFGAALSAAATVPLIPQQSAWKFLATPSAPSASWKNSGFDDASWPAGPGPLGFGESYIATPVPYGPNGSDKYRTTYFR